MNETRSDRTADGELFTAGLDVGSSAIKTVILRIVRRGWTRRSWPFVPIASASATCGKSSRRPTPWPWRRRNVAPESIAYAASTGEGELVDFRRGHFYGMTTHARGAVFLVPEARAVLDVGALHARAMRIDEKSRVLGYRMTSQCASGSGQFLENVARYLGVALEEVGSLSRQASTPEQVSSICAVLAETDVINMVSRGISTADILKGIHLSMVGRYLKLLRAIGAEKHVLITGGLAADEGLAQAMREQAAEAEMGLTIHTHPNSIYAGALGAALWGGFRHRVLARRAATTEN